MWDITFILLVLVVGVLIGMAIVGGAWLYMWRVSENELMETLLTQRNKAQGELRRFKDKVPALESVVTKQNDALIKTRDYFKLHEPLYDEREARAVVTIDVEAAVLAFGYLHLEAQVEAALQDYADLRQRPGERLRDRMPGERPYESPIERAVRRQQEQG